MLRNKGANGYAWRADIFKLVAVLPENIPNNSLKGLDKSG